MKKANSKQRKFMADIARFIDECKDELSEIELKIIDKAIRRLNQ